MVFTIIIINFNLFSKCDVHVVYVRARSGPKIL